MLLVVCETELIVWASNSNTITDTYLESLCMGEWCVMICEMNPH